MCLLLLFRLKSNSTWLRNPVNHKLCSIYNSTVHLEKRGTTDITQFSHVNRGIYRTVLFCVWFCRNWYYLHHHSTYRHTYPPVRISHRQTTRISHHDIRISQNSKSKWTTGIRNKPVKILLTWVNWAYSLIPVHGFFFKYYRITTQIR